MSKRKSAPRMRMFAGPNDSGKSTIKAVLPPEWLGVYINADDIEQSIRRDGFLDISTFSIDTSKVGGHPVPEDKIISRYFRSLALLSEAVKYSDRTYIFDNSGHERVWVAELTDSEVLEMKTEQMPNWFKTALWDKFDPENSEGTA